MHLTNLEVNQLRKIASIANKLIAKAEPTIITADLKDVKAGKRKANKASGKNIDDKPDKSLLKGPENAVRKLAKKVAKKAAKKIYPKLLA